MSGPVLVTGAAGRIGTWLRGGLPERGWAVRCLDVVPVADARPGEEQLVADVTDLAAMVDAAQGAAAVVHLAGVVRRVDLAGDQPRQHRGHLLRARGRPAGRRPAGGAGQQQPRHRVHARGPAAGLLREDDAPPRPDTYYGVAKVTMEALGSLYADRYGMDVVCLRIGSAFPEPTTVRQLATWLSPADTVSLVDAALTAPSPGFAVVWGVSDNTRNWWDLTAARALGLRAGRRRRGLRRGADRGARRARPDRSGARRVGGEYTLPEFDAENVERRRGRAGSGR